MTIGELLNGFQQSEVKTDLEAAITYHMIEQSGSPTNFDAGPCVRMHKDVAKKPVRVSQKCHATFTMQAASHHADCWHIIDLAYNQLGLLPEKKEPAEEDVAADACGSSYGLGVHLGEDGHDEENLHFWSLEEVF